MNDLSFIEGQLLATQAAIRALIKESLNPPAIALVVQKDIERVFSSALSKSVSDAYVEWVRAAKERILP